MAIVIQKDHKGPVTAVCGCGAWLKDYRSLDKALKKVHSSNKKVTDGEGMVHVCLCGGTLVKVRLSEDNYWESRGGYESHHTKRVLQKHLRRTIRQGEIYGMIEA